MSDATQELRALIVDDETPARNRLRDLLCDCAPQLVIEVAGEAANGVEALKFLEHNDVDVVLSDIRMPEMDGIELAQHLQKLEDPPYVIFTTAYDTYAIRAFELHAVDYLLKPIRLARLLDALLRARSITPLQSEVLRSIANQPRTNLSIQERGKIHLIPVEDILYLKAELKYVTAKTLVREYILEESLINLEEEFAQSFVRIHRNCLVAKKYITGFERISGVANESHWVVLLKGLSEKLQLSRRQRHLVKEFGRH
jgi:two-component system, LytTR family, response regulator AlgR